MFQVHLYDMSMKIDTLKVCVCVCLLQTLSYIQSYLFLQISIVYRCIYMKEWIVCMQEGNCIVPHHRIVCICCSCHGNMYVNMKIVVFIFRLMHDNDMSMVVVASSDITRLSLSYDLSVAYNCKVSFLTLFLLIRLFLDGVAYEIW